MGEPDPVSPEENIYIILLYIYIQGCGSDRSRVFWSDLDPGFKIGSEPVFKIRSDPIPVFKK